MFAFALKIGVVFFPPFYLLDRIVYPDHHLTLLAMRLIMSAFLAGMYLCVPRMKERFIFPIFLLTCTLAAFCISLMCFITKDGFASPYYAGNFLVLMTASAFFRISTRAYIVLTLGIVTQHFILLSFLPFAMQDLAKNLFFLGSCALIGVLVHRIIYQLAVELKVLRGFLPICAKCKKIRDKNESWHRVEDYIRDHSEVKFTHGLCPQCMEAFMEDANKNGK